jgi:RNA polymerase sigma-70 factor (ECF subfamily)
MRLKEPLLLTYFDELSQAHAAAVLGVTVKTVETRVYRARKRLAELLGDIDL